jgi:hypothetical protein
MKTLSKTVKAIGLALVAEGLWLARRAGLVSRGTWFRLQGQIERAL